MTATPCFLCQLGVPKTTNFHEVEFAAAAFTVTVVPASEHVEAIATPDPLVEKQLCEENPAVTAAVQDVLSDIEHEPVSTSGIL